MRPRAKHKLDAFAFVLLVMLTWQIGAVAQAQPKVLPTPTAKRVLLLYTYGDGLPAYEKATPAFISVMNASGINTNDLFFEYLDLQRNDNAEYRRRLGDLLRYKYAKHKIELIVTVHTDALNFLLKEGKGLFPDAPVFSYLLVSPELIEASNTRRRILQRPQNLDMKGTLEIALKMFPETRKIVFVTGTASGDRRFEREAKRAFEPWRDKLEFQYTSDRSVEEILQWVANLPPRSVVIYSNVFSDRTGRTFTPREVGKMVAKAANSPVFCLWDTLIGSGVIGGSLMSFEAEGAYAANMALNLLNGKIVLTKPVTTLTPSKTIMFDSQQLTRWGVNRAILPKESIVLNREPTIWDFKYYIIAILALGVFQWILIGRLLAQRRRRAKADEALKERLRFEQLLSDISAKLLNVPPHEIAPEIEGALIKIVDFFRVSHSVLIKGFPDEHRAVITHAAHAAGLPPTPLRGDLNLPFPWASKMLAQGEVLCVPTVDRLPAEAAADKEMYRNLGVRSFLIIPLLIEGSPKYAIAISCHQEERVWSADYIPRLELLGRMLVNSLEAKRAESWLRQKTEELDQFFSVTLDLLCIANTDGYFLRLNPAWERTLGYTREELMAKQFLDFIHPDDLDRTREAVSTLTSQQKVYSFENRYRCKDGTYRWLQWSSTPAGKLIYAAARDVTAHKQAEEDLRKSEERFRMLVETMNEGLGVQNQNGVWTYVNDQLCWMLGRLPGDIAGRPVKEFLDEANQIVLGAEIDRQSKGNYSPYEITWTHVNGRKVTTIVSPKPIFNSEGQLKEVFAVITDITERKRMEEELKRNEENLRTLIQESTIAIGISRNGVITYVNKKYLEMFGYENEAEICGRPVIEQWAPESRKEIAERQRHRVMSLPLPAEYEGVGLRKDGSKFNVQVATTYLQLKDGPASIGFLTDITERKQAEEELSKYHARLEEMVRERTAELVTARDEAEVANRAKSTFLTNISHELRTPLNSILGIAQLMERDRGFPSQHRDILRILNRSGAYLLELINDLLEISKIEAGKMAPVMTSFDLSRFLDDLEEMTRLRADQKGLKLFFEYKSHLPQYIETDVRKLRQILINLLGNAIKYTEKGRVTLGARFKEGTDAALWEMPSSSGRLEFEVEDTGIGIAREDMQRIFEPFVQVNPNKTARDGTGLGLTLSRMFIEQLGGEITLLSEVGRGSIFAFDIPVKLTVGALIRTLEADRRVAGLVPGQPHYRLLVVDDSVENRFVLRRLLEQGGFTVLEAAGGQEAIDLYKSGQPHLIWMDLRMPTMDGNEAARKIRETESGMRDEKNKGTRTPIIALTAGVMDHEEPFSLGGVFDDWVFKPFRETEIFDKLEKHLGVQFVYHPSAGSATETDKGRQTKLTPADLGVLPVEWLREFSRVLRRGRSTQLIDLISRISKEHADLAGTLAEMVHVYRFDHLIVATEGAIKEASNG